MIKALAALFMLIDHIGMILFPQAYGLRIIGRLSMPLFAYCIARGFHFTEQKRMTKKYARDLFLFAAVSQVPYTVLSLRIDGAFSLNIGFTWLLALCCLKVALAEKKSPVAFGVITVMILVALVAPMDYGLYGVLYPGVFYMFLFRRNSPILAFAGMAGLYLLYILLGGGQMQLFSLAAFPVLLLARRWDDKIKLPRKFFYWFYPVHITVLLILKGVF